MAQINAKSFARSFASCLSRDLSVPEVRSAINVMVAYAKRQGAPIKETFERILRDDIERGLQRRGGPALFPCVRSLARDYVSAEATDRVYGLGIDFGSILGSAITAAGSVYSQKVKAEGEEKLLELQLKQQISAQKAAEAAAAAAAEQRRLAQQTTVAARSGDGGGVPTALLVAGGAAALIGGYFLLRPKRRTNPPRGMVPTVFQLGVGAAAIYGIAKALKGVQKALEIDVLPTPTPSEEEIEQRRGLSLLARIRNPNLVTPVRTALDKAGVTYQMEESALGVLVFVGPEEKAEAKREIAKLEKAF